MKELFFNVQGSGLEPYCVRFLKRTKESMSAYCSCPAGQNGQHCKHRFSILDGSSKNIVSENVEQVGIVQSWLQGTDVQVALDEMRRLENEERGIKAELSRAKKVVAKAMRD
jgi:uncharacterized Zn finger protein